MIRKGLIPSICGEPLHRDLHRDSFSEEWAELTREDPRSWLEFPGSLPRLENRLVKDEQ